MFGTRYKQGRGGNWTAQENSNLKILIKIKTLSMVRA